jgi:proteasome activator subunit 4
LRLGSKHWPSDAQKRLWVWFTPFIKKIFGQNIRTDTLAIWTSFLEVRYSLSMRTEPDLRSQYIFYKKDPRRVQPLLDYLLGEFKATDYNSESSFDAIKILSLFRGLYDELGGKFSAWTDEVIERCWPEISGEHDDVSPM